MDGRMYASVPCFDVPRRPHMRRQVQNCDKIMWFLVPDHDSKWQKARQKLSVRYSAHVTSHKSQLTNNTQVTSWPKHLHPPHVEKCQCSTRTSPNCNGVSIQLLQAAKATPIEISQETMRVTHRPPAPPPCVRTHLTLCSVCMPFGECS